ncbi:MAG: hypothetical protein WDA14_11790 [Sphaerochaetaceae bacterium]|nr:hypothetical protein [Sphaerochaetaceae bacterium]
MVHKTHELSSDLTLFIASGSNGIIGYATILAAASMNNRPKRK